MNLGLTLSIGGRPSGGGGEPAITMADPLFFEDFAGVADGTRLYGPEVDPNTNAGLVATNPGSLNWDAVRTGAANLSRFSPIVFGGEIRQRTANTNGSTLANSYIIAPPVLAPTDHYVQWEMDCRNTALQRLVVIKGTDENNSLEMRHVPAANGLAAIAFDRIVGGVESSVFSVSPNVSAIKIGGLQARYRALDTRETLTAIVCNGRVYFRRAGGVQLGLEAGYALGAVTGNRFGLSTRGDRPDRIDNLKMGNSELAITMNTNHRPWVPKVRASSSDPITSGTGTEVFSGSVLRTQPTRLQWALRDPVTGALVKDWALVPLADQTITASTWAATIRGIPCGLNGRNAYLVGVRPVGADNVAVDELAIFSPKHFYVALNIGLIGQSNAGQLILAQTTGAYSPTFAGALTYTRADPPSLAQGQYPELTNFYDPLDNTENRCLARLGDDLSTFWNVPVAFEVLAIAARGAGVLGPIDGSTGLPHPSNDWAYIQTHHAFAGGAYDALILSQGENETVSQGAEWEVRWQANISAYRDPSMSGQPAGTVIPVFYGITGHTYDNPNVVANTASTIARNLGQANLQNSVSDCILAYHHEGAARKFDEAPAVHFERNAVSRGIGDLARRLSRSIRRYYGVTVESGVGPLATGATRSGAVVTVTYNLNGAASLAARSAADSGIAGDPNVLTSWQASTDNFATLLTISSAVLTGSTVVITLAADPGGPVRVRNMSCNGAADPVTNGASYPHGLYADGSYIGSLPVHVPLLTPS